MKSSFAIHALWAVAVATAFLAGTLMDRSAASSTGKLGEARVRVPATEEGEKRGGFRVEDESTNPDGAASFHLSKEEAREKTFGLLAETNRLKRFRAVCELLGQMTADNYPAIREAFARQTQVEGRTHDAEWHLMIEQIGAVAGQAALDEAVRNKTHPFNSQLQMRGWAAADPRAARAWFENQSPEVQRMLISGLMGGMAASNPSEAVSFGLSLPTEMANAGVKDMVDQMIQQGGFRAAEEALATLKLRGDVELQTRRNVAYWISTKKLNAAKLRGDLTEPLRWAEGYLSEGSILGPAPIRDFLGAATRSDPGMAIQWLEKNDSKLQPDQAKAAYGEFATTLIAKDPQQLEKWYAEHQSHPLRSDVAAVAATQLVQQGRLDESSAWIERIEDPGMKIRIEGIKRSRTPQQAVPAGQ